MGGQAEALETALALLAPALTVLAATNAFHWPAPDRLGLRGLTAFAHARQIGHESPALASMLNEAGLLRPSRAQYGEAEPLMRRALAIDRACHGESHAKVAIDLNNLASLLFETARITQAPPLFERALRIKQASLPEGHPAIQFNVDCLAALEAEIAAAAGAGLGSAPAVSRHPLTPAPLRPHARTCQSRAGEGLP